MITQNIDTTGFSERFGKHKIIPWEFRKQCLLALSYYPELADIQIEFVIRKQKVPLTSAPTFGGLFRKHKNRTYRIAISKASMEMLDSIILQNLSFESQVGVLGHELAHVADMKRFGFFGFISHGLKYTFSSPYGDKFEYDTDRLAITHGLGFQLLSWSAEVRKKLNKSHYFREKDMSKERERYMSPATIEGQMKGDTLYKHLLTYHQK